MSNTIEMIDEKYDQVFREELIALERRREHDPSFGERDAAGVLHNLYIMDGNNWDGRGEIQQASMSATIAAYEHFISELKRKKAV